MSDSKVWTVERSIIRTFYIFEPVRVHIYEPNINLIRLILMMQNPIIVLYYLNNFYSHCDRKTEI